MSGVEIAGLVLGAIPLVISALEHYEDFLDPTKAFFLYRGELDRAIRDLRVQYASYEQSIQILLTPVTDEQEMSDMLDNSNSAYWQDSDIKEALRTKLGKAYSSYIMVNGNIQAVLVSLASKLNINGADRVNHQGLEAIISAYPPAKQQGQLFKFDLGPRVKFSMKRQRIKKLLEELKSSIKQLDEFYSKAEKLEEPYKAHNKSKFALPLQIIRENAARIYKGLSKTWCSSHTSHSAGLLLEHRLVKKPQRGTTGWKTHQPTITPSSDPNCFNISVRHLSSTKTWSDIEIRIVEFSLPPTISSPKVKIIVSSTGPSYASNTQPLAYSDPSKLKVVQNLCSTLQHRYHPWMGFCLDDNDDLRGAYPAQDKAIARGDDILSLNQIIARKTGQLSRQQMYSLAITLTSSLLQLSRTPWLQQCWTKEDIIFIQAKDDTKLPIDVLHPYLTQEHKSDKPTAIRHNQSSSNDCSKLLALGVMLLEIFHGQPIETLRTPEDLGPNNQPTELSSLNAAQRWLKERQEKGDVTYAFRSAISHCLKCFVDPVASLDNDAFIKTVEQQVLAPLEEEMNYLLYGPSSR